MQFQDKRVGIRQHFLTIYYVLVLGYTFDKHETSQTLHSSPRARLDESSAGMRSLMP